jgi:hypothetical protein
MQSRAPWWVIVVAIVVAIVCSCGISKWVESNCNDRGGHVEYIYGGRGGYTCDGTDR